MTEPDPDCLHCRIGDLMKAYLKEQHDAGNTENCRIDNVLGDLSHCIIDVLRMSTDPVQRVELAMFVVKDVIGYVRPEMDEQIRLFSEAMEAEPEPKVRH